MAGEQKPQGRNARLDFRVEMALLIRYRIAVPREGGGYQLSPLFNAVGVNFSGGGAAFKAAKEIPKGYFILMETSLPNSKDPILAVAEVMRQEPDTLKGKPVLRTMIRYTIIHPDVQDRMVGFFIGQGARQSL